MVTLQTKNFARHVFLQLIAMLNACKMWQSAYGSQHQIGEEEDFCSRHCLDFGSLLECNFLFGELKERLIRMKIHVPDNEMYNVH